MLYTYKYFQTYFSSLDIEKDISTGLLGPIIICNRGVKAATDFKHSIIFFGEVDESLSWYFKENVKKYGPGSNTNLNDTELLDNNKIKGMKMINYKSDLYAIYFYG